MQAAAGEFSPEETMFATAENPHLKNRLGLEIDPRWFRSLAAHPSFNYDLPIFITENGLGAIDQLTEDKQIHDPYRITYLQEHLVELRPSRMGLS